MRPSFQSDAFQSDAFQAAGALTAGQLSLVREANPRVYPVIKVSWPGQSPAYYTSAGSPLSSARFGPVSPLVETWDDITYKAPDYRGGVEGVQTSVTLLDLDRTINNIMHGRYRWAIELTPVEIFFVTDDATNPDITLYKGIIAEMQRISTLRWRAIFRTNDEALMRGSFNLPTIDSYLYPNAVADAGKFLPLPFGWFESNDGTVAGTTGSLKAIRTGLADGTGGFPYRYLAAANWLTSVKRVCVSGVPLANSAWVRTYGNIRGMAVTELWLAADPGANAPVTYDAWGIGEDVAGSSTYLYRLHAGEPIRNPTRQMQWLLLNHVFGSYRPVQYQTGLSPANTLATSGMPLDADSWNASAAYDDQRAFKGCIPPPESQSENPAQLFADWCRAWGKRPHWTPQGKLALALMDWNDDPGDLDGSQHLRYVRQGTENDFAPSRPSKNDRLDRIRTASWVVPASNTNRTVAGVQTGIVAGPKEDVFYNRFSEAAAIFDPTVMPTAVTRVYFVDCVTQFGNTFLSNAAALTQMDAQQFGATTSLVTTAVTPPIFRTGGNAYLPNGRPYAQFEAANARWMFGQAGDSWGSIITAAEHTMWVVFKFSNATLDAATPNANHPIITDQGGGYNGIYLKKFAGLFYVYAHAYDGAHKTTAARQVLPETWYIARSRHYGGNLFFSIDNWTEDSVACGNLTVTTGLLALGGVVDGRGAIYSDVSIAAVVIANSGINMLTQGNETFPATPGLHDNYRIWSQLKERYGVS